jgi:opacity protein-like surface antigen
MKKIILTVFTIITFGSLFTGFAQSDTYLKNRIFVEGLYIRNIGNFGDVWANASGGYIGYGIAFPDHNYLMMRTGFINNKLKDELSIQEDLSYKDAYLTIVPVEIGGRYYFIDNMFMPFAQFMTGLDLVFENEDLVGENEDKNLVKFAWQVGFGLTVNIISSLSLDVGVNYQSNFYDDDAMNTGFEYAFGIGWALGN